MAAANLPAGVKKDITQCIGNTPLVQLRKVTEGCVATVAGQARKHEPAVEREGPHRRAMIDAAERDGKIKPGHGDYRADQRQYGHRPRLRLRGPRLQARGDDAREHDDRAARDCCKALGAEVILTPAAEGHAGRHAKAEEIRRRTTGNTFMPQQFKNPANPEIHRKTTAEEIWRDTDGKVDILVSGVGTGGTITGVSEVIKRGKPSFKAIAVEPVNSPVITQKMKGQELKPGRHTIQGLGAGFIPDVLNVKIIDEVVQVKDEDAVETSRKMATLEGILCGISSGAAAWAALQVAKPAGKQRQNDRRRSFPTSANGIFRRNFTLSRETARD